MHTRHIEYLLPDYVTGRLEEPLRSGVASHLEECAECKGELETLRHAFQTIGGSDLKPPPGAYFSGILPGVRERLEQRKSPSGLARPLITRFALPLAVGVLAFVLLTHIPVPANNGETAQNPLRPVLSGVGSEELMEIALDQMHRQAFSISIGENESSAMLAVPILSGKYFLTDVDSSVVWEDPLLGDIAMEDLETLTDADLEVLVARLSERTSL